MRTRRNDIFVTIRTEGAILPADLLKRIADRDKGLGGLTPESYHLAKSERFNEIITRSWNRLQGVWASFRTQQEKLPGNDLGTSLTRERWLLILFQELGYGRLKATKAVELDHKSYPISHFWENCPIHLVGYRVEMDRRAAGVAGAARTSPHSLVQELLNQSEDYLWGFVSNGFRLRILRDNKSLTRQAYVEFDLEGMMDGEVYSDFALLWLLCHQSRIEGERPELCWLEKWSKAAKDQGTRALDRLRDGVENAIKHLGAGFLREDNPDLKDKLRTGTLDTQEYYRQILRIVYRLIFLFVAEERELLFPPDSDRKGRETYSKFYSVSRLRRLAERHRGTSHTDLWHGLWLVFSRLSSPKGCPELALPALGSFLWSEDAVKDLAGAEIANESLLDAVRSLCFTQDRTIRRAIDYKNIGAEELGSVYESLLEMHPDVNADAGTFELRTAGGNERKTTGAYYTPDSLVQCLLDSALEPVVDEAIKKENPEQAILNLKVCDPACGSGHFLIAAAHRMAKRLAAVRTGDDEPAPEATRQALRDIVGRCLYGVDINPMAVELCKVSLWMEAMEPGKPLSFLEHHIKCGNSLLGTTPALLEKGIPDDAFKPIEGDDKDLCAHYRKENKRARSAVEDLFGKSDKTGIMLGNLPSVIHEIDDISDDRPEGLEKKRQRYEEYTQSSDYLNCRLWADSWCAAFVWKKTKDFPYPITEEEFRKIERNPYSIPHWMRDETVRLSGQYQFFHWHVEFPDVFHPLQKGEKADFEQTGWLGGFDVVLGNPPWERIKLQEKEWFDIRVPDIANAPNKAARQRMIDDLAKTDPSVYESFLSDRRKSEGDSHLTRTSGKFPLCGRGDINTYTIFTETKRIIVNSTGRVGCVVPSGIATDDTTKFFFQDLMQRQSLVCLYDFENREAIFPGVHRSYKFCLLTMTGIERPAIGGADFVFFALNTEELLEEARHVEFSEDDLGLLNPNTLTCPVIRDRESARILIKIYHGVPVLRREKPLVDPWRVSFLRMFDMANDSDKFLSRRQLEPRGFRIKGNLMELREEVHLPLYEGKMFSAYDHRFAHVRITDNVGRHGQPELCPLSARSDPHFVPEPEYWINQLDINSACKDIPSKWFVAFKAITANTNERTAIATVLPRYAIHDNAPVIVVDPDFWSDLPHLCANFNTFVFDFCTRLKMGTIKLMHFVLKQLPLFDPSRFGKEVPWGDITLRDWLCPRLIELIYTSHDLSSFGVDFGYAGPPLIWDDNRRFSIAREIDALFFHLYGLDRSEAEYVMETFESVRRRELTRFGFYRTKDTILEIYDQMAEAMRSGKPYQTRLDPPPGPPLNDDGSYAPLPDWPAGCPKPANWPSHIHEPRRE